MRIPKTSNQTLASPAICRNIISFLFLSLLFTTGYAQSVWTWMSGDNTINNPGVYGSKGTAATTNKPGSRYANSGWKDASGNFWIFGGLSIGNQHFNDLWLYNTGTKEWTWVSGDNTTDNAGVYGTKGIAAATNKPGGRFCQAAWTDANGNFWIFGGVTYDEAGSYGGVNDLWKFDPTTSQWTWISGDNACYSIGVYGTKGTATATNMPGARYGHSAWIDASGNFWIFGGEGLDAAGNPGFLNDLWMFDPTTSQWTWVSGDNTVNNSGVYGTRGTAAATNLPGSRQFQSAWMDATGNFWIFGGGYADGGGNGGYLNDLWKYDPTTGQWTWVSGDNTYNSFGVYGTKGTPAATNKPGARYGQNAVIDGSGNVWIFAGYGYGAGYEGSLNELWKYSVSTGQWTWISGDNTGSVTGVYGTKGTGATNNKPGSRGFGASWIDATGNFWSFGGFNFTNAAYNDLWEYTPVTVLPLRKISQHGTNRNGNNIVHWETTGEENTNTFIVERSTNGSNYTAIGTVAAIGSGNNRYSFTDYGAANASYFYRLQVSDKDAQTYYSIVITLNNTEDARISIYPNPAGKGITVALSDNSLLNTTAKLYTATGQLAGEVVIRNLQQYIDLQRYPKGVLTLKLNNGKAYLFIKE